MILQASTRSIRAFLGAAAATTNPVYTSGHIDRDGTTLTPGGSDGALNGTTAVTVVGAPSGSAVREVHSLSVYNVDTAAHTVTVEKYDGTNQRRIVRATLNPHETLLYHRNSGWLVLNGDGAPRAAGSVVRMSRFLRGSVDAANLTATLTLTSGSSFFEYLGPAPVATSQVRLRFRVTTAAATITWAEVGIFRGAVNIAGNPTLERLGTADVSGIINSTGQKTVTVTLSTAASVGDDLWAAIGNSATTAGVIRAGLADDLQSGVYAVQASYRPSTGASPNTMTLAGATTALPWITGYID